MSKSKLRHFKRGDVRAVSLALGCFVLFSLTTPGFAQTGTIYVALTGLVAVGLVALAVGITMIAAEFDLAAAATASLSGVVAFLLAQELGLGIGSTVLASTAVGALLGAIQGWAIVVLRINSLMFTVGTMIAIGGVALAISAHGIASPSLDASMRLEAPILVVLSPLAIVAIVVFVTLGLWIRFTRWGRHLYAVGGARDESRAAGVPVGRVLFTVFLLSGALAGLAGGLYGLQSGTAASTSFDGILMDGVTAALIGGVSVHGGRGNPLGIAMGVLVVLFVRTGAGLSGVSTHGQSAIMGGILVIALLADLAVDKGWSLSSLRAKQLRAGLQA